MPVDRTSSPAVAIPTNPRFVDLRGRVFERLVPVEFIGIENKKAYWRCKCSCGNIAYAYSGALKEGRMKSCGCYQAEIRGVSVRVHGEAHYPNGLARQSTEYTSWMSMKARCFNKNSDDYDRYGGRGITVTSRWLDGAGGLSGYECFLSDMKRKPTPKHQLDRYPNNDGNYQPNNCRWATPAQQQRNRSDTIKVLVNGREMALADACEALSVDYQLVSGRMDRGWLFERAVAEPKHWRGQR